MEQQEEIWNTGLVMEATANLDNQAAAKIKKTVLKQKDTTAIVVTYKMSHTLLKNDCIVVMHRGKIAEYGKFDELMEKKKSYYVKSP